MGGWTKTENWHFSFSSQIRSSIKSILLPKQKTIPTSTWCRPFRKLDHHHAGQVMANKSVFDFLFRRVSCVWNVSGAANWSNCNEAILNITVELIESHYNGQKLRRKHKYASIALFARSFVTHSLTMYALLGRTMFVYCELRVWRWCSIIYRAPCARWPRMCILAFKSHGKMRADSSSVDRESIILLFMDILIGERHMQNHNTRLVNRSLLIIIIISISFAICSAHALQTCRLHLEGETPSFFLD